MTTDLHRFGDAGPAFASPSQRSLDYYLILSEPGRAPSSAKVDGILVEEFEFAEDSSTIALRGAGWTAGEWWDATSFSRRLRTEEELRRRLVTARRDRVEHVYRRFGTGELPAETTLRSYFGVGDSSVFSPPLRLGLAEAGDGFDETRVYRILFTNDLSRDGLAALLDGWRMTVAEDVSRPATRVVGSARLRVADDLFTWDLRRVGPGVAWAVDLTANLAVAGAGERVGPLLRVLTAAARDQGLIPVTIDRFS
ncbi:hypothetical protein BDK92_6585 [Micromonospora pisi]|uniref:Uncharacterized protein n=1 Tax=Micromonospora pisi TaxID=589240 RepID=A0A495JTH7_9ACTN|nr:hypothetical protein [Micromonospora pisi]RKR92151.1 hypothetical protein BDK92_6585 [Micromonospora pisi]